MKKITEEAVLKVIADHAIRDASDIKPAMTMDDLGFDSLDHLELVMALEEEFRIEIWDEDQMKFFTFHSTVESITNYMIGRNPS